MNEHPKPPCADWGLWHGPEVEGEIARGVQTLFVRRGDEMTIRYVAAGFERVWFCHEYDDWEVVRFLVDEGKSVCLETNFETWPFVPDDIKKRARIYFKTGLVLKTGDHLAVGEAFSEEQFCVGTGVVSSTNDYLEDVNLE